LDIKLNEKAVSNLVTFLKRVDLKGVEVSAFNEIILAIHEAAATAESSQKEKVAENAEPK
jgi:hypothetical protein